MKRRNLLKLGSMSGALALAGQSPFANAQSDTGPIKVGILHSLSGTMAISETSLKDTALMTISEINKSGGVNGRQSHKEALFAGQALVEGLDRVVGNPVVIPLVAQRRGKLG